MDKLSISRLVMEILDEIRDCDDIQNDTLLLERGILDSLSILYLISELEEKLTIKINLEDVEEKNFQSIDCIAEFIFNCMNA